MALRLLTETDRPALEAFLGKHQDSSMILRSNLMRVGIDYEGERFQAHYFGAFQGSELVAVAAHNQNGVLFLQAPVQVDAVALGAVAASARPVTGFIGPGDDVRQARAALGMNGAATRKDGEEGLYALELSELVVPVALANGALVCRAPRPEDTATLYEWRVAYDVEVLGGADTPAARENAAGFIDWQIADGSAHVATDKGALVAYCGFNSRVPDMVQLGGVYTPPALRGRGYARAAIASKLLVERERGVTRAVLFTDDDDPKAVGCYAALGFRRTGAYGFVLFA